jgi:hypothetical protein
VQAGVVATRSVAAVASFFVKGERPVVVDGDSPPCGIEEGEVGATRGTAAVAGPEEELAKMGAVEGAAESCEITAAKLGAGGGAAGLAGLVEELIGADRIGLHATPSDIKEAKLKAARGPSRRASGLMECEGTGQSHRFLEGIVASPHREGDFLPGSFGKEQSFERTRAVDGRAVESHEPVAGTEAGAGGGTVRVEILEDRFGGLKAGAERHGTRRSGILRAAERQQQAKAETWTHSC